MLPAKRSKYKAVKTVVDGLTFDSKAEARRFADLKLMERAGQISQLCRQVKYELAPGVRLVGEARARPPIRLIVDFSYIQDGNLILEDVKGMETPFSRAKRHLMKTVHGLDVRVTR